MLEDGAPPPPTPLSFVSLSLCHSVSLSVCVLCLSLSLAQLLKTFVFSFFFLTRLQTHDAYWTIAARGSGGGSSDKDSAASFDRLLARTSRALDEFWVEGVGKCDEIINWAHFSGKHAAQAVPSAKIRTAAIPCML